MAEDATRQRRSEAIAILQALIAGGESYYVEFKSAWDYGPEGKRPRPIEDVFADVGRTLVAFANSDGGDLLVGVEDDGGVTGVPWEGDLMRYLVQAPRSAVLDVDLGVAVQRVELGGETVLWFRVPEHGGEPVVTADGRCLWRREKRTEPVPPREIERRRSHRLGDVGYESAPVPEAGLEDLDEDAIERATKASSLQYSNDRFAKLETLLRYWNLVEVRNGSVVLRRAALLLFARDPLRWHPNNRVRVRRVHGDGEGFGGRLGTRERQISGPIARLLPEAIELLRRDLETESRVDTLFTTTQTLPHEAIEECLVNAVVHRNYAIEGQAVEILIHPDRVEVRSPGRLPEPITVTDLVRQRGVHRSRNPVMMRVLRDLGWSRDQGEGMRRIFGAMRQVELHVPELEEDADTFVVRLSTRSIYDEATQAWIASYGPFGLRPQDRKYLVALRDAGGALSNDRLARMLGESFDATKRHLQHLEHQGFVWHGHKSRTYHVVEAPNVPHERALHAFVRERVDVEPRTVLTRDPLRRVLGVVDEGALSAAITRWKQAGILRPDGSKRWRFGESFLRYVANRGV